MSISQQIWTVSLCLAGFALTGCDQTTTQDDVESAREAYEKQAREAEKALEEGRKKVGREFREAGEAHERLEQKEAEFASEQARADYVNRQRQKLTQLETTVAELKARAERLEDDAKPMLDDKIARIEKKCGNVGEMLDELEEVEVDEWTAKREHVELAINQTSEAIDEAQQIR